MGVTVLSRLVAVTRPIRYEWDAWTFRRSVDTGPLRALSGSLANRPCLVVGNGPSLNNTPLDKFANIPAIGTNKIDLLFNRIQWRPSLLVCVNNIVVKQHADNFARTEIPVFLSWKSRYHLRSDQRHRVNFFLSLPTDRFSTDIVQGVGFGSTVTYTALQFAYYMGANPVIIVGVDHSFSVTGNPHQIARRQGADQNHFDPNYFKAGTYWALPDLEDSERAYARARAAFESAGRRIVDATIGGQLRVFDKVSIEDAIRFARI